MCRDSAAERHIHITIALIMRDLLAILAIVRRSVIRLVLFSAHFDAGESRVQ